MKRPATPRWATWLPGLLLAAISMAIFPAWLAPENVAAWLQLLSFCS